MRNLSLRQKDGLFRFRINVSEHVRQCRFVAFFVIKRVVHRIGQNQFDIVSGLIKRNGFDKNSPFRPMIEFCSPAYGPRRTGVVGRRGKGLAAGESIGNQSEVFAADGEIGGKIGEFAVFKILQGFLPG